MEFYLSVLNVVLKQKQYSFSLFCYLTIIKLSKVDVFFTFFFKRFINIWFNRNIICISWSFSPSFPFFRNIHIILLQESLTFLKHDIFFNQRISDDIHLSECFWFYLYIIYQSEIHLQIILFYIFGLKFLDNREKERVQNGKPYSFISMPHTHTYKPKKNNNNILSPCKWIVIKKMFPYFSILQSHVSAILFILLFSEPKYFQTQNRLCIVVDVVTKT